ncbi:MAG: anthranilate phosphoribosyltransferase [Verrucomicrobia bacterium]|nr:anthranilate phosphoribosyltransferase [Verrucomicrobiota bacterium]MCG2680842.1 anthranilate phosphoribosyltransferase [Kiritimatiellia bacterium]MBU4246852.1 anthranilate phosphoribosyltransferase [Verrucomicrobiota bacterium]MBU4290402.1 anthranilate phosphoribosyltransferase [Verrucomicrobiota bacterium]MBU4430253.1 anthranilate phosphoribosyltransferase [Verrucomicrobiota bacterium]
MKQLLQLLIDHRDIARSEMEAAFDRMMTGALTPAQIAAFIMGLRMKGESVEELAGAAASMRRHAVLIDTGGRPVVDTCGTGGDGAHTFNISTAAALVVAGAGVPVAKHGNRAVTSRCGSADVLAALGVNIEAPPETVEECIREIGIGFLYAPMMHPAMKHAAGVRRELGIRTIFNMLGPLTNPAGAKGQILGVFDPALTEPFAHVLRALGSRRAFIVHGHDGLDEITVTTATRITELRDGKIRTYEFDPLPLIGEYHQPAQLAGGDPSANAAIIQHILSGEPGAGRDIVLINAAAGIVAGGKAETVAEGYALAAASIDQGRAREVLGQLIARST